MYVVYNSKFIKEVESNGQLVNLVLLEIGADSAEDFPAPDAEEGQLISFGSIGYEINTGDVYVLNSEGTWKNSNGEASSAKSMSLSSPSLQKGQKIEVEQPDEKELEILETKEEGGEEDDELIRDPESK